MQQIPEFSLLFACVKRQGPEINHIFNSSVRHSILYSILFYYLTQLLIVKEKINTRMIPKRKFNHENMQCSDSKSY